MVLIAAVHDDLPAENIPHYPFSSYGTLFALYYEIVYYIYRILFFCAVKEYSPSNLHLF